jgi:hypothetical protein
LIDPKPILKREWAFVFRLKRYTLRWFICALLYAVDGRGSIRRPDFVKAER